MTEFRTDQAPTTFDIRGHLRAKNAARAIRFADFREAPYAKRVAALDAGDDVEFRQWETPREVWLTSDANTRLSVAADGALSIAVPPTGGPKRKAPQ